jgi:ribosomal protein L11 methyltransferase
MEVCLAPESEELWSLFCYDRGAGGAEQMAADGAGLRMRYFFSALAPGAEEEGQWIGAFRAAYPSVKAPSRLTLLRRQTRDWQAAWREHFTPTAVGRGFMVCPPWAVETEAVEAGPVKVGAAQAGAGAEAGIAVRTGPKRIPLIIEPGQGFGTGGHASTVLALEMIEAGLAKGAPPAAMLDVGTGSGILAIGAALLGVEELWGLEIDPRALPEVRRNFRLNGLSRPPRLVRGKPDCLKGGFPLVVANLTAPILRDFVEELTRLVSPGGCLVLSGMLASEGPGVEAVFAVAGCNPIESAQRKGWHASRLLRDA